MLNKHKHVQRTKLRFKLNQVCQCKGKIVVRSHVDYSFGINDGNSVRILLKDISIEDINIDHVWVKCDELNDAINFQKGRIIYFIALVLSYQKINGSVAIGLFDLKNIKLI